MRKISLIILSFTAILFLSACGEQQDGQYAEVAQCLAEKEVKFYGAYWCNHCTNQKKMFGNDFKYITSFECDPRGQNANPEACREAGVEAYPTWTFPGQENEVGVRSIEFLAQKANCEEFLPQDNES
jgi:hypothetical protein